mmetsp:Transcript_2036/g.6110  ORF Transcript_2036/g.6110 Transcript_2036/m.6110 type:complete len:282 (+) Transcript_2036:2128-2973(+)
MPMRFGAVSPEPLAAAVAVTGRSTLTLTRTGRVTVGLAMDVAGFVSDAGRVSLIVVPEAFAAVTDARTWRSVSGTAATRTVVGMTGSGLTVVGATGGLETPALEPLEVARFTSVKSRLKSPLGLMRFSGMSRLSNPLKSADCGASGAAESMFILSSVMTRSSTPGRPYTSKECVRSRPVRKLSRSSSHCSSVSGVRLSSSKVSSSTGLVSVAADIGDDGAAPSRSVSISLERFSKPLWEPTSMSTWVHMTVSPERPMISTLALRPHPLQDIFLGQGVANLP